MTHPHRDVSRLAIAFGLVLAVFVAEVLAAFVSNSLALLSDAGHMLTDALGLGMALAAILVSRSNRPHSRRTFGTYRLEILAALANAVLLVGVAVYVIIEAVSRLGDAPEIATGVVLTVSGIGLVANVVAWRLLRPGSVQSLNLEGAYLEVVADLIASIGVFVGAGVVRITGWTVVDPIIALAIGLYITPRALALGRKAVRILIQAAPEAVDVTALRRDLAAIPAVASIHDLHVWTLTSQMDVVSAHLVVEPGADDQIVLRDARRMLGENYRVGHATLQVEDAGTHSCAELTW